MSNREFAATLKGIGPNVPLSEIEISARQAALRREMERYAWLHDKLAADALRPLSAYLEPLRDHIPRVPGTIEASLVALSMHADPMARLVLATYEPPDDLALLHLICRDAVGIGRAH